MPTSITPKPSIDELLTPEKTAKVLNTTVASLATARYTGSLDLPFIKLGRKILYKAKDVQGLIERQTVNTHKGIIS